MPAGRGRGANPLTPPPHVMAGIEEQTLERLRET